MPADSATARTPVHADSVQAGPSRNHARALRCVLLAVVGVAVIVSAQGVLWSILGQSWGWHGVEVVGPIMVTVGGYGLLLLAMASCAPSASAPRRFGRYRRVGRFLVWVGVLGLLIEITRPTIW